ncbi:Flagellin protein FlaA [Olavius algarvensis Delta 1 endosymbiont]|nr:Flagellin protein FlaA [Olavius algarvensis Delta 1 endosymbiont]
MAYGITLTSGMRNNLFSLQQTNKLMEATQTKLASGQKVNSALDDPVAFFTAQSHEQRAGDLAARKDEMSESVQLLKAGDKGIEAISTLITAAKSLATSALSGETTSDISTLQTQYFDILSQVDDLASDSGYKGVNLLDSTAVVHEVKFDETGDSKLTITGFDADSQGATLSLMTFAANAWVSAGGTADKLDINSAITRLDDATSALRTEASKLATNLSVITARQDFTSNMINTLRDGAANLVNADMNEEGANMLMLQTRQALSTSSLSMASQAAQSVLRLF